MKFGDFENFRLWHLYNYFERMGMTILNVNRLLKLARTSFPWLS